MENQQTAMKLNQISYDVIKDANYSTKLYM